MTDESLPRSELDEIRQLVKNDAALQAEIRASADKALIHLAQLRTAGRTKDKPLPFTARGVTFALNLLHPDHPDRGLQVILVDETGVPDRNSVIATYRPQQGNLWSVWEPGLEVELSKKIVGRSRLYYYPAGDSKTRWASNYDPEDKPPRGETTGNMSKRDANNQAARWARLERERQKYGKGD